MGYGTCWKLQEMKSKIVKGNTSLEGEEICKAKDDWKIVWSPEEQHIRIDGVCKTQWWSVRVNIQVKRAEQWKFNYKP